jgi:cation-transporting ATPase 13A1
MLIFESSTVFQRSRTQAMLRGMAPQPSPVHVLRDGQWVLLTSTDLLPGDIISIVQQQPAPASAVVAAGAAASSAPSASSPAPAAAAAAAATGSSSVVPCDCVILRGSAVVNEASLTGESVPQMKEALAAADASGSNRDEVDSERLDMNGVHRTSVLFSGTTLIVVDAQEKSAVGAAVSARVPPPPDHGAIAYVLRTGFR